MFEPFQVPIQFWQHGVADLRLHTEVKAASVLDYACDEPTLPPYITLTVKGAGSSEVTADMNFFREYNKLYYENFIYIAATHTFSQYDSRPTYGGTAGMLLMKSVPDITESSFLGMWREELLGSGVCRAALSLFWM